MQIEKFYKRERKFHFTLIDPCKQPPSESAGRAKLCENYGTDAIMVGGSHRGDFDASLFAEAVSLIKKTVKLPVILFPDSAFSITPEIDYIFFMSLLNSRDPRFLIGEQIMGAPIVRKYNIKPISMAYILISTDEERTTVEKVAESSSKIDRIKSTDIEKAVNYALCADYFGFRSIYLEAGSGAKRAVPDDLISSVRSAVNIPIIVGGGIRDGETARKKIEAGADAIVTGTITENEGELNKVEEIVGMIRDFKD